MCARGCPPPAALAMCVHPLARLRGPRVVNGVLATSVVGHQHEAVGRTAISLLFVYQTRQLCGSRRLRPSTAQLPKCHPLQTLRHIQLPMVPITEDSVGIAHMVPGNANLHLGSNTRTPALTTMYPSRWASRASSREVRICDPTVRNRSQLPQVRASNRLRTPGLTLRGLPGPAHEKGGAGKQAGPQTPRPSGRRFRAASGPMPVGRQSAPVYTTGHGRVEYRFCCYFQDPRKQRRVRHMNCTSSCSSPSATS